MDFHGIDLNLLVAFDALMTERNVTRAAARVGVSQPAMSAALARLRTLLGDALFARSAEGLLPTPRARELAVPIAQALHQLQVALVERPEFEPGKASLAFKLGLSDYPAYVLLPTLLQALAEQAPGVSVNVYAFNDRDHAVDMLDSGLIDAAVGVPPTQAAARILSRTVLTDEFVTIVAHDHPVARRAMTLKTYLELRHVLVSPEGDLHGLVDHALAQQGKQRELALTLPQMFAVPSLIARTRLTATVMRRVAMGAAGSNKLVMFPPPVTLPRMAFDLIWHRRSESHPAQQWFRGLVEEVAGRV
ncbi:LysR family transcriptional regulator [Pseudomonas mediterranea]|uniref:LysR family transcriptional regulator n=1 Tax=Pseudomonas mediterranea TaxID=183795 RepID=UPI0006D8BC0E|nr:LysR family transcriptional regulator [Pseudomonas mediterranea]MBL0845100.1 LysR family transcriptional regulator [Pseudomonas mediterranea]QHA84673.1 LysR family transcriptional regulator [Pseudomonas mediterranea]UZE00396.1 LysR family transcriptional regulator [Pseudomonas mediterranea]